MAQDPSGVKVEESNVIKLTQMEKNVYEICNRVGTVLLNLQAKKADQYNKLTEGLRNIIELIKSCNDWALKAENQKSKPDSTSVFNNDTFSTLALKNNQVITIKNGENQTCNILLEKDSYYIDAYYNNQLCVGWKQTYPRNYSVQQWGETVERLMFIDDEFQIGKAPYPSVFGLISLSSEVIRDNCMVCNIIALYANRDDEQLKKLAAMGSEGLLCMCAGGTWLGQPNITTGAKDDAKRRLFRAMAQNMDYFNENDEKLKNEMTTEEIKKYGEKLVLRFAKQY